LNENVAFEAFYPHPAERVWQALTDPKALANWMLPTDFRPLIGFRFRFEGLTRGKKGQVTGEVLEVVEGARLRYTWDDGEAGSPSVVTWTLQPQDGGTRVSLTHEAAIPAEPYILIEANLNWRYAMYASLPVVLALMRENALRPPVPITYITEAPSQEDNNRRAGFRQEEETVCRR